MNDLKEERASYCEGTQPEKGCSCKEESQSITALREINAMLTGQLRKLVAQVDNVIDNGIQGVDIQRIMEAESTLVSTIMAVDEEIRILERRER